MAITIRGDERFDSRLTATWPDNIATVAIKLRVGPNGI